MSKKRTIWLRSKFLPAAIANAAAEAEVRGRPAPSDKTVFRKVKKWWRNLSAPEKQAVAKEVNE